MFQCAYCGDGFTPDRWECSTVCSTECSKKFSEYLEREGRQDLDVFKRDFSEAAKSFNVDLTSWIDEKEWEELQRYYLRGDTFGRMLTIIQRIQARARDIAYELKQQNGN